MTFPAPTPDTVKQGKKQPAPGTARAAWGYRDFRLMWSANFLSSVGTWMQNVVLPAYIYTRTHSATVVSVFVFAQLGPLLLMSIPAGVLADRFKRRNWLTVTQSEQLVFSVVLGFFAWHHAPIWMMFAAQLCVGIGNAANAPAFSAVMPSMVRPEDLGGSISLSSAAVNGSRVAGPIIVAVLSNLGVTVAQIFWINAATYLFVVWALFRVTLPPTTKDHDNGWRGLGVGIKVARERKAIGRLLLTLFTYSLISLTYVGLFAAVAQLNFGIKPKTAMYKWLYATWGLGAMFGALLVGSVFAAIDKRKLTQWGFMINAFFMVTFALSGSPLPAFITGFFLGASYFGTTTAMSTIFQGRLEIAVRARVLALWFMCFGGTIPIGNFIFAPIMDHIGSRPVLLIGAAWTLFLAWWCNIEALDRKYGTQSPVL